MATLPGIFLFALLVSGAKCSDYDPSDFPEEGPYVEHWVSRVTSADDGSSYGVFFGKILPASDEECTSLPNAIVTLYYNDGPTSTREVEQILMSSEDITIHIQDSDAESDWTSDVKPFQWAARNVGSVNITADRIQMKFCSPNVCFQADFSTPIHWGPNGESPEGWLRFLPLPVHWYVQSFASHGWYRWENRTSGKVSDGHGYMYQDKSWGNDIPTEYMLIQGYDSQRNISIAYSFGTLQYALGKVTGTYMGYRNFKRNLILNFSPDSSSTEFEVNLCECSGTHSIETRTHLVQTQLTIPRPNSIEGVYVPSRCGYKEGHVVGSYSGSVRIQIFRKGWWRKTKLIEDMVMNNVAFEFGSHFLCEDDIRHSDSCEEV